MQVKPKYWMSLAIAILLALAASDVLAKSQEQLEADVVMRDMMSKDAMVAHLMCYSALYMVGEDADLLDRALYFGHQKRHEIEIDGLPLGKTAQAKTKAEAKEVMIDLTREQLKDRELTWPHMVAMAETCKEI